MKRFVLKNLEEAAEEGWAGTEEYDLDRAVGWNDWRYSTGLFETDGKKSIRLVGTDGGEPEDQRLYRDWEWVVDELNKLAEEK